MTQSQRGHVGMALVVLLVAALTAGNWHLRPDRGPVWLIGGVSILVFWLVIYLVQRRAGSASTPSEQSMLSWSGIAAGLIVAAALGLKLADAQGWGGAALRERGLGLVMGVFLIGLGNAVPKMLAPLSGRRCSASHVQALQRFTGWTFVISGAAYVAAWLVLPNDRALVVSTGACATAVVLVLARVGWALSRPRTSA